MNDQKRGFLLGSGVLSCVNAVTGFINLMVICFQFEIFVSIVTGGMTGFDPAFMHTMKTFMIITFVIMTVFSALSAFSILFSIRSKGKFFDKSRGLYLMGVVLTILTGPISLAAIMLYIAMASNEKNQSTILHGNGSNRQEPQCSVPEEIRQEDFKVKIEKLRKLREEGKITEEEFKKMLGDLL